MLSETPEIGTSVLGDTELIEKAGNAANGRKFNLLFDAEWSYRYLHEHSTVDSIEISENLTARISDPALLFALNLHSGRLADARDLVILGSEADLDSIEQHIHRGNPNQLAEQTERVLATLQSQGYADSFKGVFQQK